MSHATATRTACEQPRTSSCHGIVLQRKCACGGRASGVTGECSACRREKELGLQTKLAIGVRDDPLEREADRIADQVMGMTSAAAPVDAGRAAPATLARRAPPIASGTTDPTAGGGEVPAIVGEVLSAPGQRLDVATRQFMEPRFGHDFGQVRVHTGPRAAASAEAVVARAYTVGHDLVFADAAYRPGTHEGRRLLAHELAHTLQQGAGTRLARQDPDVGGDGVGALGGAAITGATAGAGGAVATPTQSGGGGGSGSAAPTPTVDSWTVRNSGATEADNCCSVCPVDLGVDIAPPKFKNGIELKAKLDNHSAGYTYDIKRTKEAKYWRRNGAADPWATVASLNKPAGTSDDSHNSDECLTPKADGSKHKIYSEDRPGFASLSSSYTDYVQMINFVESVRVTSSSGTSTEDPRTQNWHTKLWVTKDASGTWSVNTANSEIASGHLASLSP